MSDDILHLRHPAPVLVVPKGRRSARVAHLAVTTPVRPLTCGPGAILPLHVGELGLDTMSLGLFEEDAHPNVWEGEGRLWLRADGMARRTGGAHPRLSRGLASLQGLARAQRRPAGWSTLERFLIRTPFRGWHAPGTRDAWGGHPGIRVGRATLPAGKVVDDLTDFARSALTLRFERDLRLCDGHLFLAFEGLHRVFAQATDTHPDTALTRPVLTVAPRMTATRLDVMPFCVRADREGAWRGFADGLSPRRGPSPSPSQRALAELSSRLGEDADVSLMANELPARILAVVGRCGATKGAGKVDLAPLARWAALGSIGAIPAGDEPDALGAVWLATCEALRHVSKGPTWRDLRDVRSYLDGIALPVVSRRGTGNVDDVDALALSGVAA